MNYQEFLQRFQYQDSPYAQQEYRREFGGSDPEFSFPLGDRIGGQSSPGKIWGVPSGHASAAGQGGMTEEYAQELERRNFPLPEDYEAPNLGLSSPNEAPLTDTWGTGVDRGMYGMDEYQGPTDYDAYKAYLNEELTQDLAGNQISGFDRFASDTGGYNYQPEVYDAPTDSGLLGSTSTAASPALETGASGYPSVDSAAGQMYGGEGVSEGLATDTAASGSSAWGGPATFAGNMALNMIPTHNREKVDTPIGDKGSKSGMLKGTGKGALVGATIGSQVAPGPGTAWGAAIGGGIGLLGGAQGYFDSTSPPIIQISRVKSRGGSTQGLLGGGSMYG